MSKWWANWRIWGPGAAVAAAGLAIAGLGCWRGLWPEVGLGGLVAGLGIAVAVQCRQRAEAADREVARLKDEFLAAVSHELKTPLASIYGALKLLTSGQLGELSQQGRRMATVAFESSERLVALINDMLDLQRLGAGKSPITLEACDGAALLEEVGAHMGPVAERGGVALSIAPAPAMLWADRDRLAQALRHLIGNAVKFTPAGGRVDVRLELEGAEAVFRVADTGRGIPASSLETIFDRFHQLDGSDARSQGGTGLGLALCRGIARLHGGRIWAESAPGAGATFYLTVPLASGVTPMPTGRGDAKIDREVS